MDGLKQKSDVRETQVVAIYIICINRKKEKISLTYC